MGIVVPRSLAGIVEHVGKLRLSVEWVLEWSLEPDLSTTAAAAIAAADAEREEQGLDQLVPEDCRA